MESNYLNYEPMDIDLSSQSVKDMDISYIDSDEDIKPLTRSSSRISVSASTDRLLPHHRTSPSPVKQPIVRKGHIIIQKPPRTLKGALLKLISAIFVIFISIIAYHMLSLRCCDQFNLNLLRGTLSHKLYGQSEAINSLINTLETDARSKIVFFSGGTGVGKTFTSSLLLDTVGSYSNVYHYTMPTFESTFSTELMWGLTMCKTSLIIVDDLTINDFNIKTQIKNVIDKSQDLDKDITVILIFNCNEDNNSYDKRCDQTFHNRLLDNFAHIKAHKRLIEFKPLTEDHLKACIRQELGNKQLNDREFQNILKNFNVSIDGCKGVHSKMKYLNYE
ncbi:uncharacterized protein LOC142973039 [Anticarsia gemmatalis]|uniref:uncharacterized protein LOC142973039 n=1 Tax=Anticarsia gemmatalis TaxID=129554 RepID=UPI003F771822